MEINTGVIKKIIKTNDIYINFQPIVSVNTRRIVGVEALSRGCFSGMTVSPYYLFEYAKDLGLTAELNRICREKALEAFSGEQITPLLFLNFDFDTFENTEQDSNAIIYNIEKYNIPKENIVIEINEKHDNDNKLLKFVHHYHNKGFNIALDDVGSGHSNLNRISIIKPDIVKIDMALIHEIDKSPLRQEVLKSIINLSKKIGAYTVAEGVEKLEEVIICMLCGVDFFQGFYFSAPKAYSELSELNIDEKIRKVSDVFNENIKQTQETDNNDKALYISILDILMGKLEISPASQYEDIMWEYVFKNHDIECIFLTDIKGIQISDTIILENTLNGRRSLLYAPSVKGDSHEIKNYYYAIKENIENPFISDWYISNATGNSCKTLSSKFINIYGETIIVCVDLKCNKTGEIQ